MDAFSSCILQGKPCMQFALCSTNWAAFIGCIVGGSNYSNDFFGKKMLIIMDSLSENTCVGGPWEWRSCNSSADSEVWCSLERQNLKGNKLVSSVTDSFYFTTAATPVAFSNISAANLFLAHLQSFTFWWRPSCAETLTIFKLFNQNICSLRYSWEFAAFFSP